MKFSPMRSLRLMCGTLLLSLMFGCSGDNASFVEIALTSITLSPATAQIAFGTEQQFSATGTYSDLTTQDITASVVWSSSSTTVATISNAQGSNGLATSVGTGTTTITAALGSVTNAATLTVTAATLSSIAIAPSNATINRVQSLQYAAIGTYSDGTSQNITTLVIWNSSDPTIATIANTPKSKKGQATGVSSGSVTITATMNSVIGATTLTVN